MLQCVKKTLSLLLFGQVLSDGEPPTKKRKKKKISEAKEKSNRFIEIKADSNQITYSEIHQIK
tara:strand:- start:672 stop:860 length:189 start_codon:yes stop_codon:yes gene_type:complete